MSLRDKPHYKLPGSVLADWIECQSDKWWSVDGDPVLGSVVDFPCPSDELGPCFGEYAETYYCAQEKRP